MSDKETIRRGYDELGETYAARRSEEDRELAVFEQFLDSLSAPIRILDAGCGQGTPVLKWLSEETTAIGVDFSRKQLRLAAKTVSPAVLVHGDMTGLPFRDNVFDAVIAYNSIIHIPLADHQTVLDEFARVLCSDGRVLLSEAPEKFERTTGDWLDNDTEMKWNMAGAEATCKQLQNARFQITDEWNAQETGSEDTPRPPFFAARLDT